MNTEYTTIDYDEDILKNRRLWYVLGFSLLLLSLIFRQALLFLFAMFTLLIALVPNLWYRTALRHLVIRQRVSQHRLFFGEEVLLSVSIENQKFLPLPWLQVENTITPPLVFLKKRVFRLQDTNQDTHVSTWLLWSFERVTRNYRMRCQSRGLHTFGPMRLRCSDPFGWLECEVSLPTSETLLVYPLIAPLETLGLPSVQPFGDYAGPRYLLEDPLRVAGVRDYVLGDDPRRIHWKATAHAGSLRSKIYEPSSFRRLLVLLDAWNYSDEVKGIDTDIQEFTISATASIALWGLNEGYMVGLLTNCGPMTASNETLLHETGTQQPTTDIAITTAISPPGVKVPFALDAGQRERILTLLARLVPTTNTTMERLIDIEDTMFPLGTTIVLVSAASSLTEETIDRLDGLRMRGAAVHLALINNTRENTLPDTYNLPVHMLGGKEQWFELARNIGVSTSAGTSATPLQLD